MLSSGSRVRVTPGAPKNMKIWVKILIIICVGSILFFSIAYLFISFKAKALLIERLEELTGQQVSIGYLGLRIPLNVEIRKLSIGELADVSYASASVSITGLFRGKIVFNDVKIVNPEITWQKTHSDAAVVDAPGPAVGPNLIQNSKAAKDTETVQRKQSVSVIIKHLTVKDGIVNFVDRTVSEQGLQIVLRDIKVDIDNLYLFPHSAVTDFQMSAKIPWQENSSEGTVYASGWINYYKKDIQARLEIEGIDGVYLYPYYSTWVDLENSRIEQARLNFFSDIQGEDNDIVAQCRLELVDIKFRPRPLDQPEHKAERIATAVLGIFRALNQGRVVLNFTVRTKMDKPEFSFINISKAVDETINKAIKLDKVNIEDAALLPRKLFEGVTKGTAEATRAIINGALSVGKSILDVLVTEEEEPEEEEVGTQQENPLQE